MRVLATRAYITHDDESTLRVTVRTGCTIYDEGNAVPGMSWAFPIVDDGVDHLFGSQSEKPFKDADRILAENGWTREGRWAVGDAITGTYARIARA